VVAVVVAPFFAAIIIATWSGDRCGRSSQDVVDVVHGRRGRSSVELLGTWSELGGAVWHGSLVGSLDSSAWLA